MEDVLIPPWLVILCCAVVLTTSTARPIHAQNTGALLPNVQPTFFNASGSAVNSLGFVCTTVTGGTTALLTYQDSALTTANQDPIRLNAAGRAVNGSNEVSIYLQAQAYRISVYAAGTGNTCNGVSVGTLLRQIDPVYDLNQINNISGKATAGRKVYTVAPSGAVQADKNLADYIGDGVNDQNAVNAALTASGYANATVTMLPGIYTFGAAAIIALGTSNNNFVFNAAGSSVTGAASADVFRITGVGDHDTFNFGEINVANGGTGIHLLAGITQSYITWKALIGTSRTGTGFFADAQNADGGQSSSTSYIIGSDIIGFNRGIAFIADTSFFFDTYQITLSFVQHNNVGIYVHGLASPAINNNIWKVNVDCSQNSGDICIETNAQSDYFTFIPSGVNGVGGVGTTQHNVQLDSGAQWNQFNFTATSLALVTNSVVDNSGNNTNRWNASSHTQLNGVEVNCLTTGLTYGSGAQQDKCTTDVSGSSFVGIPAVSTAATAANSAIVTVNPSNSGFSTIDCDKTGTGLPLPCQMQMGGVAIFTANTTGGNGQLLVNTTSTDFTSGITVSRGTLAVITGTSGASANSQVLTVNASGGDGNAQLVSTHSGAGTTKPLEVWSDSTQVATAGTTGVGAPYTGFTGIPSIVAASTNNAAASTVVISGQGGDGKSQIVVTHTGGGVTQPLEVFSDSTLLQTYNASPAGISVNGATGTGNFNSSGSAYLVGLTAEGSSQAALCQNTTTKEVQVNTGVQTCTVSSLEFKDWIEDISCSEALRIVKGMRPAVFKDKEGGDGPRFGFAAEWTAAVEPRLVDYDKGKPRAVDYERYSAVLTKALQCQLVK